MSGFASFYGTSVGKKVVVAVTGALLVLFLIVHAMGNLLSFEGAGATPETTKLNEYARLLRVEPAVLWTIRLVLLGSFILHVWTTVLLTLENRRARGTPYAVKKNQASTFASRTMIWGGLLFFVFVVYHLLHFTVGAAHPSQMTNPGREDVFGRVVASFRRPEIALAYLFAQVLLFFHLRHGIQSAFETLGVNHPRYRLWVDRGGPVLALLVVLAFMSVPVAIWMGVLGSR